jgi:hypothetical protein
MSLFVFCVGRETLRRTDPSSEEACHVSMSKIRYLLIEVHSRMSKICYLLIKIHSHISKIRYLLIEIHSRMSKIRNKCRSRVVAFTLLSPLKGHL